MLGGGGGATEGNYIQRTLRGTEIIPLFDAQCGLGLKDVMNLHAVPRSQDAAK